LIEGWQRTFMAKSSRRRSRERFSTIISRGLAFLAFSGVMLLALWVVDNAVNK
jgi:hypothetical protein